MEQYDLVFKILNIYTLRYTKHTDKSNENVKLSLPWILAHIFVATISHPEPCLRPIMKEKI